MTIPKDILTASAAGKIPSDISLEYLAQTRDKPAIIAILFVGIITLAIVSSRLYARAFVVLKIGIDDYLIAFTSALYITFIALSLTLIKLGSSRHIDYIHYVLSNSTQNTTESLDFYAHLVYTFALFTCRISGLAFYNRLCDRHQTLQLFVKIAFAFITAAMLPQMFLIIFHCKPVTSLWLYSWQPGVDDYTCLDWGLVYLTNSVVSLVSDLIIFLIPAALIVVLKSNAKSKMKLFLLLFPGLLVIIISIIRLYFVVQGWVDVDVSWVYAAMLSIETSEIGGTIIALSIPGLKPLFGNALGKWGYTSSRTPRTGTGSRGYALTSTRNRHLSSHLGGPESLNPYERAASNVSIKGTRDSDEQLVSSDYGKKGVHGVTITQTFESMSFPVSPVSSLQDIPTSKEMLK